MYEGKGLGNAYLESEHSRLLDAAAVSTELVSAS